MPSSSSPPVEVTDKLVYSASLSFPMAKVKIFMLHWKDIVIALELNTTERRLYFLSQVLYLTGEFLYQNDFSLLYKIANEWKKHNLNKLVDIGDLYGIIRILSPMEHDMTSLEYLERLNQQLAPICANT